MKTQRETLGHWLIQRIIGAILIPIILIENLFTLILLVFILQKHVEDQRCMDLVHNLFSTRVLGGGPKPLAFKD